MALLKHKLIYKMSGLMTWYGRLLLVIWLCYQCNVLLVEAKVSSSSKRARGSSKAKRTSSNNIVKDNKAEDDAFVMLAEYASRYARGKTGALRDFEQDEVTRAVAALASAQQAWKSMDGATHSLKNTFKESTSLRSRFNRFIDRKSKNTKEAVKLFEYITTVERGMQACEIMQAIAMEDDNKRSKALYAAGLQELHRAYLSENKINVAVSLLLPQPDAVVNQRFQKNEVVICIVDRTGNKRKVVQSISQWLRLVTVDPLLTVPVSEDLDLDLQPTVLNLAIAVAKELKPHLQQLANPMPSQVDPSDDVVVEVQQTRRNLKLCVLGHSTGGAVAAYLSMMLDGCLNGEILPALHEVDVVSSVSGDNEVSKEHNDSVVSRGGLPLIGRYRRRVICRLLGPPPCIGRAIVPRFVTSIVCGDDIIPRATLPALVACQVRILQALESGAGRKNMAWLAAPSLLKDLSNVASSNLNKYKGRKKAQGGLQLPGRVFFIKSRQLKQGATIQRILRGNWQEEVLWNIHDILISKKMLDHHSLDAYIRTLNRC